MNRTAFNKDLFEALLEQGFVRDQDLMRVSNDRVVTLVGVQKGFGSQWFINVGFWFSGGGIEEPGSVEQTHLYFRLERLFPQHREIILAAGDLRDAGQPEAYQRLAELIGSEIATNVKRLGTEEGLVEAYRARRLEGGLVTKVAKEWLLAKS
ncbi:DUF4304 domain-containing protein [Bradyrhizobium sp. BEA-2-5]|uniref:DUF4304 domain-containing protein n=1 Tax=Bradyrhizobium TaxID=374 RepID=UPI001364E264|nr:MULTISPECIES: DUF4304 domain-containing protein [Bradyrhizobium]WOH82265.1 DUF4304 domain-containing protein [Bradyrhizobium sp. BEA-2-5]